MNKAVLLGRLVKEPEIRYTPSNKVVAQFTLAIDRPYANQEGQKEADFIPVVLWGKSAETFGNTVGKGQRVLVEGRIQTRSYDAKDGSKRYVTEVIAERFEYIELKNSTQQSANSTEKPKTAMQPQQGAMDGFGSAVPFSEEIPF